MNYYKVILKIYLMTIVMTVSALSQETWIRTYHIRGDERAYTIDLTDDGGYIVGGWSTEFDSVRQSACFIKVDQSGLLQWSGTHEEYLLTDISNVISSKSGEFLMTGNTSTGYGPGQSSDPILLKVDSTGSIIWTRVYAVDDNAYSRSIFESAEDELILAMSNSALYRLDQDGYVVSMRKYSDEFTFGSISDIIKDELGKYYGVGRIDTTLWNVDNDWFFFGLDTNGDTLFTRIYDNSIYDNAFSIDITQDNGFIIAGGYSNQVFDNELLLHKFDSDLNIEWSKKEDEFLFDIVSNVKQTPDDCYVVTGSWQGIIRLKKYNPYGEQIWKKSFELARAAITTDLKLTPDGGYVIAGYTVPDDSTKYDMLVIKTNDQGEVTAVQDNKNNHPESFELHQNYPNPFNPETKIQFTLKEPGRVKLAIYNTLGQRVKSLIDTEMSRGQHSVTWDGTNMSGVKVAGGVYIYRMEVAGRAYSKKMILLK